MEDNSRYKSAISEDDIWKNMDAGDVSQNKYFRIETVEDNTPLHTVPRSIHISDCVHRIMLRTDNYAKGVEELFLSLKDTSPNVHPQITINGSEMYRPLTVKETIEAKIQSYNRDKDVNGDPITEEQKRVIFQYGFDTCTGIAYTNTGKFKIIPICTELVTIDLKDNSRMLSTKYSKISSKEIEVSPGLYCKDLSLEQVLVHPGWLAALEYDNRVLEEYAKISFKILKDNNQVKGMEFNIHTTPDTGALQSVYIGHSQSEQCAIGGMFLDFPKRFLLLRPKPAGAQ